MQISFDKYFDDGKSIIIDWSRIMGDFKMKLDSMDERESRGHLHKSVKGMVSMDG